MAVRILETDNFEGRVSDLCDIMNSETDLCRELLELSRTEQGFLIKNDLENLANNTDRMKSAVEFLKESQDSRHECMGSIASLMEVEEDKMTIRSIRENVRVTLSEKLKNTSRELTKVGEKLYRTNHNTVYLIDFSLDLLEQQNRLWVELVSDKEEGYSDGSRKGKTRTFPLLVEKKV